MKNLVILIFLFICSNSLGQIYTFKVAREIYTYNKITTKGDTIQKVKKVEYDSCWVGFSERGVIYIDLFIKDTSYMMVLSRKCLEEDKHLEIRVVKDRKYTFSSINIIFLSDKKTIGVLHLEKPILQWNINWVDDYFEYFREDGYNPQIEQIEEESLWFYNGNVPEFKPFELIEFTK